MEQAQQIIVSEVIALIEQVIMRLRKTDIQAYNNYPEDRVATKVYTRKEVAKILHCSPNKVTGFIRKRMIHASVFNRRYYVGEKSLLKFIVERTLFLKRID